MRWIGGKRPTMNNQQKQINPAALPLQGIRVVELGTSVAAPYGTWILASLGAEVVKVERPGKGDDARYWGPILGRDLNHVSYLQSGKALVRSGPEGSGAG